MSQASHFWLAPPPSPQAPPRIAPAHYLNRIHAFTAFEPTNSLRFYVEAQDARAPGFLESDDKDSVAHRADLRQAYVQLGNEEHGWMLRGGRQEIALGDERLIGADTDWDPLGFAFEAVRGTYTGSRGRVDLFAAFLIKSHRNEVARSATRDRVYGVYVSLAGPKGIAIDPYVIWKSVRPGEGECRMRREVLTYGVRSADDAAVRVSLESNMASGDQNSADREHGTFDDLYPAGYNRYGMPDPFGWRNTRNASLGGEWRISTKWQVAAGYRWFALATTGDGLYTSGDDCMARDAAAGSGSVGRQLLAGLTWDPSARMRLAAGFARLWPGPYLERQCIRARMDTPFASWQYRF